MLQVDKRKSIIYCTCDGEAIRLEPDVDYENNMFNNTLISIWERGVSEDSKTSWKDKWELIKRILKYGTPYSDQVIIDQAGRKLLIQALQAYDMQEPETETHTSKA
ncbi:MAG: hypothetical protein PF693_04275 [Spirochaetia bacterium]|jgi:hypothetical protein|nr:hypothetical protein [Spirochaetia bacterium]